MNELDQKKIIIPRIISYMNPAPANAVNELLKQPLKDLEVILERLGTKREHDQIRQDAQAEIDAMREASKKDGAWAHCLLKARLNGKVLADTEANRQMMESLLAPHESPSSAVYETIALTYPQTFSWQIPKPVQTDAERRADFERVCRENVLSLNAANEQLHREGVAIEQWSGASEVERQRFAADAAQARQKYLINSATPDELKAEANYEFKSQHDATVKEDAARREKYVADQQRGNYPQMPLVDGNGVPMDAQFFRKLSTDFPRFKALVKRFGSHQVTDRLRQN